MFNSSLMLLKCDSVVKMDKHWPLVKVSETFNIFYIYSHSSLFIFHLNYVSHFFRPNFPVYQSHSSRCWCDRLVLPHMLLSTSQCREKFPWSSWIMNGTSSRQTTHLLKRCKFNQVLVEIWEKISRSLVLYQIYVCIKYFWSDWRWRPCLAARL